MKRPDTKFLARIEHAARLHDKDWLSHTKDWLSVSAQLPLIQPSAELISSLRKRMEEDPQYRAKILLSMAQPVEKPPFDMFVFHSRFDMGPDNYLEYEMHVGKEHTCGYILGNSPEMHREGMVMNFAQELVEGRGWEIHDHENGEIIDTVDARSVNKEQANKLIKLLPGTILQDVYAFMDHMNNCDLYPIARTPIMRSVGPASKKLWKNPTGPSVIYMNTLPQKNEPHKGGTHASPKSHQRRGHTRRLTHERFGVTREIYVKPSWVGPRQTISGGNTYTLIQG